MTSDYEYGKLPPQAIDIEQAVLGSLMLERDAYSTVADIIDTASFYKDEHRKIFEVVKHLSANDKPIDLLIVTQELKNRKQLEEIGGAAYITQLTRRVASAAHIEHHAQIIAEKYYLRESIIKASEIIKTAYNDEIETLENIWQSAGELDNIFALSDTGTSFKEVLKSTIIGIEKDEQAAKDNRVPGVPTGFVGLDTNTGGWRNGDLIILASRPGNGKTSLALIFALIAAKAGFWVNIFSLEMKKEDLARIIIAGESEVYRSNIRDGYLEPEDWEKINEAIGRIENLPILFRDAAGMTVNQIKGVIHKNKKNGKCNFAIVDYLQLVKSQQSKTIREQEVSEISRTLKTCALNEDIPILALSQLNREAEGQIPKLSHLRESGAIEQDADMVFFLMPNDEYIRMIIAKHRRGRLGDIDLYHNDEMTKFSEQAIEENVYPEPDIFTQSNYDNSPF